MCSNDPGNVKKYTSPEEFFRDHDPTQLVSRESKEVETAIQIAEQAVAVCAEYIQSDGGLRMLIEDNRCHPTYDDKKKLSIAKHIIHLLYARHLLVTNRIGIKECIPDSVVLSLEFPRYKFGKANDCNIPHLVRFWLNTYLIRETKDFKEKWEQMEYIMKYTFATDRYEYFWNNFWVLINYIVYEIYQQNCSYYDSVDSYAKNYHPFQKDEFEDFVHKIGGHAQLKPLLPRCSWLKQGGMILGCEGQIGFSGITSNGQNNIYARKPSELWKITSTTNDGKRNYRNRVNIQHLFYRMLVGPIEANNTLQKKPDGSCTKGNTTSVCFNPFCFYQVKRGVKRKWRPTTDKEKEDFAAFLTVHPGIADWVDF